MGTLLSQSLASTRLQHTLQSAHDNNLDVIVDKYYSVCYVWHFPIQWASGRIKLNYGSKTQLRFKNEHNT